MSLCNNEDVFAYLQKCPTDAENGLMTLLRPLAEAAIKSELGYTIEQATYTHFLPETDDITGEIQGLDVQNGRVTVEYTETTDSLWVPERPLRSITTLYEDSSAFGGQGSGDFAAGTLLTSGTDYFSDYTDASVNWTGLIRRINGAWSPKGRTIKVTYVAGLTAAELSGATFVRGPNGAGVTNIKMAAIIAVALAFKQTASVGGSASGPIIAERLADYSVQYGAQTTNLLGFQQGLPKQVKDILAPFRRRTV